MNLYGTNYLSLLSGQSGSHFLQTLPSFRWTTSRSYKFHFIISVFFNIFFTQTLFLS